MMRPEVHRIFRMEMPTNLKLGTQMEYKDPYHQQAARPPRSEAVLLFQVHYIGRVEYEQYRSEYTAELDGHHC